MGISLLIHGVDKAVDDVDNLIRDVIMFDKTQNDQTCILSNK